MNRVAVVLIVVCLVLMVAIVAILPAGHVDAQAKATRTDWACLGWGDDCTPFVTATPVPPAPPVAWQTLRAAVLRYFEQFGGR